MKATIKMKERTIWIMPQLLAIGIGLLVSNAAAQSAGGEAPRFQSVERRDYENEAAKKANSAEKRATGLRLDRMERNPAQRFLGSGRAAMRLHTKEELCLDRT